MLNGTVALLILQAMMQKAPAAPPPNAPPSEMVGKAPSTPAPSPEVVGKTQSAVAPTPAVASCVTMPDPAHRGARALTWYINAEPMEIGGRTYARYGLPRVLSAWEIEYFTTVSGGLFYAQAGVDDGEVLYLLVDPAGCEFQPYGAES